MEMHYQRLLDGILIMQIFQEMTIHGYLEVAEIMMIWQQEHLISFMIMEQNMSIVHLD